MDWWKYQESQVSKHITYIITYIIREPKLQYFRSLMEELVIWNSCTYLVKVYQSLDPSGFRENMYFYGYYQPGSLEITGN